MTQEQKKLNQKNHDKAAEFFCLQRGWVLHHINSDWKRNDIERYIQWNVEDLVMMTRQEHQRWHSTHDPQWRARVFTKERAAKISKARKGQPSNTKGKHWHIENGRHVYTN